MPRTPLTRWLSLLLIVAITIPVAACDRSNPATVGGSTTLDGVVPAALVGSWTGTGDDVSDTYVFATDGSYSYRAVVGGQTFSCAGTVEVSGAALTVHPTTSGCRVRTFTWAIRDGVLWLTDDGESYAYRRD